MGWVDDGNKPVVQAGRSNKRSVRSELNPIANGVELIVERLLVSERRFRR